MPVLDDFAEYITSQSTRYRILSGTSGNFTKSDMPDSPDTMTSIYITGGLPTISAWSTGDQDDRQITRWRLQVLTRSTDYTVAQANNNTIFSMIDGLSRCLPTSTGRNYPRIDAVAPPFDIGKDGNERHMLSCNYDVWRQRRLVEVTGGAFASAYASAFDVV